MKKLLSISLLVLVCFSCKEEVEIIKEIEKEQSWKLRPGFEYDNAIQMNSFATEDYIYTLGINSFTVMLPDHLTDAKGSNWATYNILGSQLPITAKFPINSAYFVTQSEAEANFIKLSSILSNDPTQTKSINIKSLDPAFNRFNLLHFTRGASFDMNTKGQLLVPYSAAPPSSSVKLKAALFDIKTSGNKNSLPLVDTVKTRIINFDSLYDGVLLSLNTANENFYISPNYNETFRVDPSGNTLKVVNQKLDRVFAHKGIVYGINAEGEIYTSTDDGISWSKRFTTKKPLNLVNFTPVGDKIVGYFNSQLFSITLSTSTITITKLINDGLEGKSITSISKLRDKVYVTTLSGTYYKDIDSFFVEKPEQNK